MNQAATQFSAAHLHALLRMFHAEFMQLVDDRKTARARDREATYALLILLEKSMVNWRAQDPILPGALVDGRAKVEAERSEYDRLVVAARELYETRISVLIEEIAEIARDQCSAPVRDRLATLFAEAEANYSALAAITAIFAASDAVTELRKVGSANIQAPAVSSLPILTTT